MWNGIQSSPSFQGSDCVESAKVELAFTIVPFPSVVLTGDEVFSVRVSVRKDVAELEPVGPATSDVIVVVIVWRVLFAAVPLEAAAEEAILVDDCANAIGSPKASASTVCRRMMIRDGCSRRCWC